MTSTKSIQKNSRSTRNGHTQKTSDSVASSFLSTEEEIMKRSAPAIIEPDTDDATEFLSNSQNVRTTEKKLNKKKKGKKTVELGSLDDAESNEKHMDKSDISNRTKKNVVPQTPSTTLSIEKLSIVTPSTTSSDPNEDKENMIQQRKKGGSSARRSLMPPLREISQVSSSSIDDNEGKKSSDTEIVDKLKNKRNAFGHTTTSEETVLTCTRKMYSLVNKMTGSLGGNGHGGAIYGELTIGSMQKMIDLMKKYTDLNSTSRFIDVGCGLGKPNIHVAQDPKVEFSYGIEMEHVRWMLGMTNLNEVMKAKSKQLKSKKEVTEDALIGHSCYLAHGDITEASYFDPFTHVYMFDIGFPPTLFKQLSIMFNRSQSPYLICYHGPRLMIERYEFDVELVVQMPTSMHGSAEGHMGYIYKRIQPKSSKKSGKKKQVLCGNGGENLPEDIPCDKLFAEPWRQVRGDFNDYKNKVKEDVLESLSSRRPRRTRKPTNSNPYVSATLTTSQ